MAATLESVKKAIGKKSSSLAFAWLADLERKAGKPDIALDTVNTGLNYLPDYLPGLLVRSAIYFDLERFDEVISSCDEIVKKDPFCIAAWRRLGAAYQSINQTNKRNFCYRMVHDMDPLDSFWKEEYAVISSDENATSDNNESLETSTSALATETLDQPEQVASESTSESILENNSVAPPPPDLSNEDPFSMLSSLLPSDEENSEDASFERLESSLEDVMEHISDTEETLPEYFGGDDISETDVSSAFSSMFGMDDELPAEKRVSPFASFEIPTSIDDDESSEPEQEIVPEETTPALNVEEDKPQSLSSAFDDIFGEDELPEEKVDEPVEIDNSLGQGIFEKSASEEITESLNNEFEPSAFEKSAPAEITESLNNEFEPSAFEKSASAENTESLNNEFEPSAFEKSASAEITESLNNEFEPSAFEKSAPEEIAEPLTNGFDQQGVFEKSASEEIDEPIVTGFEHPEMSLKEQIKQSEEVIPEFTPLSEKVEPVKEAEEFVSAVDSSLSALFGEDDLDLPQEKQRVQADDAQPENSIENSFSALFGDDDDLELPSTTTVEKNVKEDDDSLRHSLEEDVDNSFASLFGNDDDGDSLDNAFEEKKEVSSEKTPEVPSNDFSNDSLNEQEPLLRSVDVDDEVSGAFASLFSSDEDDDLPEEKPQKRDGVDFLMSGDSDDEMAVALMKNPSGSLDQDEALIDENLNTKTLAEIYFEQGLYSKALNIYQDLAKKNPSDAQIEQRLKYIQRQVDEKYGNN